MEAAQAEVAELNQLNVQLQHATNTIWNMITQVAGIVPGMGGPAPGQPAPVAPGAAAPAEGDGADDDIDDIPALIDVVDVMTTPAPAEPADANLAQAAAAGPQGGLPPLPPLPPMPMNFNTTFIGMIDPFTGAPIEDGPPRKPSPPDPKREEILEKARRELKAKELTLLEKWKMGGYAPNLKTTCFDMVCSHSASPSNMIANYLFSSAGLASTLDVDLEEEFNACYQRHAC